VEKNTAWAKIPVEAIGLWLINKTKITQEAWWHGAVCKGRDVERASAGHSLAMVHTHSIDVLFWNSLRSSLPLLTLSSLHSSLLITPYSLSAQIHLAGEAFCQTLLPPVFVATQ